MPFLPTRFIVFFVLILQLTTVCAQSLIHNRSQKLFYDLPEGISQHNVNTIYQDPRGFIWIGTDDGLNKFDGYKFTVYSHDPLDSFSVVHNHITSIAPDGQRGFWVGTQRGGLNHYQFETDRFTNYDALGGNGQQLSTSTIYDLEIDDQKMLWIATNHGIVHFNTNDLIFVPGSNRYAELAQLETQILDIHLTSNGLAWIGTDRGGLFQYNRNTGELRKLLNTQADETISVRKILQATSGTIWVGTSEGLFAIKKEGDTPVLVIGGLDIQSVEEDLKGNILIGTDGNGLHILHPNSEVTIYRSDDRERRGLNDDVIREIYRDQQGNVWIGMFRGGINLLYKDPNKFRVFDKRPLGLNNSSVLAMTSSQTGGYWIGTDGGGINYLDRARMSFSAGLLSKDNWDGEADRVVMSLLEDHEGGLWAGTYEGGLKYYLPNSDRVLRFRAEDSELSNNAVLALHQDRDHNIWIGTNGGINYYDWESKELRKIESSSSLSIVDSENTVRAISESATGTLWFGIVGGLKSFDPGTRQWREYLFEGTDQYYMTYSIHPAGVGTFWLGTFGGGVLLFDTTEGILERYTTADGLPSNVISGILEDEEGDLWISSLGGLSHLGLENRQLTNYTPNDGLQKGQFNRGVYEKDEDGYFWFGGVGGLNVFHPDSIAINQFVPPVMMTGLSVLNQPVSHHDGFPHLSTHINQAESITLDHDHSVVTLEFASLNYVFPANNQYAYYLEGFDNDWGAPTHRHEVSYTNLDPGHYMFKVKGSNNDGLWNEVPATVEIIVRPPWWRTWWAYTLYLILVLGLLTWLRKLIVNRERLQMKFKLEHLELTHLQELDHLKSRFFANISHELRTPLSLILDPLKLMYDREAHPKVQRQLKTMIRNAQRLLRLINQLLDLAKLESGSMQLKAHKADIVSWMKYTLPAFSSFADQHKIKFKIELPSEPIYLSFDPDKMEKVISNLLSNALKFTRDEGEIGIKVLKEGSRELPFNVGNGEDNWVLIKVMDSGVGIPKNRMKHIFDRFYQVDGAHHRQQEGTGIGLSLTKELVELHGGVIDVDSEEGKGTTVRVYLPVYTEPASTAEPVQDYFSDQQRLYSQLESTVGIGSDIRADNKAGKNAPVLLVIEDNPEVLTYISEKLSRNYRIEQAVNGAEGLERAFALIPDLIISDVMMPVMDGIELTSHVKQDQRTSHIPVILLTAKAEEQDIYKGIDHGADDYVVKPFDSRLLEARIKNILLSREKLKERFANNRVIDLEPKEVTATPVDEMFLKKALESVENNMSNSDYTVEDFGNDVGLSRMQLYRKLKALTDQSPNEFIRTIRLKRAAQLIHLDQMTISQITYEVGFNDLQYFRDCFKKQFGVNPSDYSKEVEHPSTNEEESAV